VSSAVALLLAVAPAAWAHALHAEAKLKGDTVTVEAFFDDDTPARGAKVAVRDERGREVAAGRTDERGVWSFPRPAAGKYEVVVDAGAGHRSRPAPLTIPTETALGAHRPPPEEVRVTPGPTRGELTRFPWLRLVLGVLAVGGLAALLWLATRGKGPAAAR
jgi:hypothetical protein